MVEQRTDFNMPAATEPMDAYRTLQVLPSAPHDLIEQAYWVLVGRARSRGSNSSRLGALNEAYGILINADRRGEYDAEHGLAKLRKRPKLEMPRRPMFARKPKFTTRLTHYQLLDVDYEALPEVIDTAYVFHKAQLKRSDPQAMFFRVLIEDAYATLSDPHKRAQYDERVGPRRSLHAQKAVPEAPVAVEPPPPAPLFPPVEATVPSANGGAPEPEVTVAPVERAPRKTLRSWLRERMVTTAKPDGATRDAASPAADPAVHPGVAGDDIVAAERKRLVELGILDEDRPEPIEQPEIVGRAQFRFVDGPQAGDVIPLADNSLILGASDAADVVLANPDGMIGAGHVRVWRRDDEYILHQLDSFSTTYVNGERLDLRLAILEPGDEIRIGPHTLIYDQLPVPVADASAQAEPVTT